MMGAELGLGIGEVIWMLLFWGGLILLAIWLVSLLFPAAQHHDNGNKSSSEKRVSSNDKTTL